MKRKILIGILSILSLGFVGCSKEKLNVDFESYKLNDTEDENDIVETIIVSIDSNGVSEKTSKEILDKLENKNMQSKLLIKNIQGVEIAEVKEKNNKAISKIDKNYKINNSNELVMNNLDEFQKIVTKCRDGLVNMAFDSVYGSMKKYKDVFGDISDDLLEGKNAKLLVEIFYDNKSMNIEQIINKSKDVANDEKVKESIKLLKETNKSHKKIIEYANSYKETKSIDDLNKFTDEVINIKGIIATYEMQVSQLDGN